jgi:ABC-type uncharacterized transport system substrate-binding protein
MAIRIIVSLLTLVLTGLAYSSSVGAQATSKVYKFGWIVVFAPPAKLPPPFEALKARLAEHGYVEGKNITFEGRWADGDYERIPRFTEELERSGVDVIFVAGSKNARLVREFPKKTPIVFYTCDPFEHVARLARQGGNITGVTCMTSELTGKRLELMKEAVPTAARVVFFSEPEDSPSGLRRAQDAAPKLGIKLWTVGFKTRADIPGALETVAKERPDALFVYPDPLTIMEAQQIADFAIKQRLPTMYAYRSFVDAGGMMSYGARDPDMFKLAADQAAKIFKGAAAGDLPVLQATRFELVINLKTAKALGLTIPQSLLLRADQIIE